jgi:dTMP kinase
MKGKLIVVDGTDGSGKATQVKKLKERLINEGYNVRSLDFPQYYNNFFGKMVGEALKGDYGDWAGTHPKIASVIYANDRAESAPKIKQWLAEGSIVILDRYVSSNQIHQGGKIDNSDERKEFMQWLDTMEHDVLGIPRPDAIVYLDVSVAITQKLLIAKGNKESKKYLEGRGDQHENNIQHLEAARESGLKMISENNNWVRIRCSHDENILSIEEIHSILYQKIKEILKK